jgi:2-oxoglutarate ferredoxin oxidoreductase subunit gamma
MTVEFSIIISGFGGQGALFAGQLLAYAALASGNEVTWIPSYGPEMRGGTAHCTVVIGDETIGSPLVRNPDCVIAMNAPSVEKYEPLVKPHGTLLADSTLLIRPFARADLHSVAMPAHTIALHCGEQRLVNVAMLGGMMTLCGILPLYVIEQTLRARLPERHRHLLDANIAALYEGAAWVGEMRQVMR